MKIALSIAGFDPSSGAGITADLSVFSAQDIFGISAITALTVQSTQGVYRVAGTDPALLAETLSRLTEDLPPDGIKIGMLATKQCVHVVADFLLHFLASRSIPIVLDPVLISSSGATLLEPPAIQAMIDRLLPVVSWMTPNRQEWSALTGTEAAPFSDSAAAVQAARWPSTGFIITGGDGDHADDLLLAPGSAPQWLRADKIQSTSTHGTGCAFSSAFLCGLIRGKEGPHAASDAKAYVRQAIERAPGLGHGRGPLSLR